MTKKDIAFFKKIIGNSDYTPISKIASCYVDISHDDIRYQKPQTFMRLDESELTQYCQLFKKGVSGKLGTTVIELDVTENLIDPLRDNGISDMDEIERVALTIRDNYNAEGNYCIFLLLELMIFREKTEKIARKYIPLFLYLSSRVI